MVVKNKICSRTIEILITKVINFVKLNFIFLYYKKHVCTEQNLGVYPAIYSSDDKCQKHSSHM